MLAHLDHEKYTHSSHNIVTWIANVYYDIYMIARNAMQTDRVDDIQIHTMHPALTALAALYQDSVNSDMSIRDYINTISHADPGPISFLSETPALSAGALLRPPPARACAGDTLRGRKRYRARACGHYTRDRTRTRGGGGASRSDMTQAHQTSWRQRYGATGSGQQLRRPGPRSYVCHA